MPVKISLGTEAAPPVLVKVIVKVLPDKLKTDTAVLGIAPAGNVPMSSAAKHPALINVLMLFIVTLSLNGGWWLRTIPYMQSGCQRTSKMLR
jgi:hypothetical protein